MIALDHGLRRRGPAPVPTAALALRTRIDDLIGPDAQQRPSNPFLRSYCFRFSLTSDHVLRLEGMGQRKIGGSPGAWEAAVSISA